jgi:ankyrin repeat protein
MAASDFELFIKLVKKGNIQGLRELIASGWNVNGDDPTGWRTPLNWVKGNTEFIRLLLDAGATPNPVVSRDMTPLAMAAQAGKTKAVKMLLAAGARVDIEPAGCSLFTWIKTGTRDHPEILKMLADAGASTELRGNLHLYGIKKPNP